MVVNMDIRLLRHSKVFHENEVVKGALMVTSKTDVKHDGVFLTMEGVVNLQLSSKTAGIFEAFYQSVKPIQLLSYQVELVKPGKIPAGENEIPFEFPLRARNNKVLFETYHGVFVNIQYTLKCEIRRSFLVGASMNKSMEFIVEYSNRPELVNSSPVLESLTKPAQMKRIDFEMVAEAGSKLGLFKAVGHLDSVNCPISKPFTGEILIQRSEFPIKSIEVQLIRVETCGCAEGFAKEASEVQTIQIGEGNVVRNLPIPIFMIFPRLFACPTLTTSSFKIEFEVNLTVILANDFYKSESFPIKITRF